MHVIPLLIPFRAQVRENWDCRPPKQANVELSVSHQGPACAHPHMVGSNIC
jgi:hypothetical protein